MAKHLIANLFLLLITCSFARADTIIYATGNPTATPPVANQTTIHTFPPQSDSFFDIYISPDVAIGGLGLDVFAVGDAIRLTGMNIMNFNSPDVDHRRWSEVDQGIVAADGKSIVDGFAVGLPGIDGATGINPPATNSTDAGYNTVAQAYQFARVTYQTVALGTSQIFFQIGTSEILLLDDTQLRLGIGDAPVDPAAGVRSTAADATITVVPEPASILLCSLILLSLLGCFGRPVVRA